MTAYMSLLVIVFAGSIALLIGGITRLIKSSGNAWVFILPGLTDLGWAVLRMIPKIAHNR